MIRDRTLLLVALAMMIAGAKAGAGEVEPVGEPGIPVSEDLGFRPVKGPPGGLAHKIDFNPLDPSMVVATTLGRPAYRSTDQGQTWSRIETLEGRSRGYAVAPLIRGIAFDPLDAEVLYRGTEHGIDRSFDRGLSWSELPDVFGDFLHISVAATTPRTIIAVAFAGQSVMRSLDGGQSWSEIKPESMVVAASSCEVSAASPGLTVCPDTSGFVFVSENFGASWEGFPIGHGVSLAWSAALHPSQADVMWVSSDKGIHRSTDRGRTWASSPREFFGPGHLRVASSNPQRLYGSSGDAGLIRRSVDGGASWQDMPIPVLGITTISVGVAPDNPDLVLAGSTGRGIFRSVDGGTTWTSTDSYHASTPVTLVAGASGQRFLFSHVNFGELWRAPLTANQWQLVSLEPFNPSSSGSAGIAVAKDDPQLLYMTNLGAMSTNAGQTWVDSDLPGPGAFASHSRSSVHLLAVAGGNVPDGIYRRANAGGAWTLVTAGQYRALAAESTDNGQRAVGIISTLTGTAQVARSVDNGLNWSVASIPEIGTPAFPTGVAIDPFNLDHVLICTMNGLHRSIDGGASFGQVAVLPAIECHPSFDPNLNGRLAVAFSSNLSAEGVFLSEDGGMNWTLVNKGLSGAPIRSAPLFPAESGGMLVNEQASGILKMFNLPIFVDRFE